MISVDSQAQNAVVADDSEVVCYCAGITRQQILTLVGQGIVEFERISRITGACSGCGGCDYDVRILIPASL